MSELVLSPCDIRFLQDSISREFTNGKSVNETIKKIVRGEMRVEQLPMIRVVNWNNFYYAFDNRRLYVYRVLHYRGKLNKIRVSLAPTSQLQPERFTSENNGATITVRGDVTLKHSKPEDHGSNSRNWNSISSLKLATPATTTESDFAKPQSTIRYSFTNLNNLNPAKENTEVSSSRSSLDYRRASDIDHTYRNKNSCVVEVPEFADSTENFESESVCNWSCIIL